jgi:serine/threonine protein kinase/WD40 repeat protein
MPSTDSARDEALERLAAEFVERHRRGERPPLSEYTERHPDLADDIRDLFPALVQIERLKPAADPTGDFQPAASADGTKWERLGDYRILREVGRGGMGVVYEAEQESLGRRVALKVLPPAALLSPTYLERFRREARAAARLHHTNIVPVFGVGEAGGTHFYAMQFIRGEGLDRVLADVRRLRRPPGAGEAPMPSEGSLARSLVTGEFAPPAADGPVRPTERPDPSFVTSRLSAGDPEREYYRGVARLGVQAAQALAYAHRQGVLHRDVKPSNLLLDAQGTVWVTDFGLAKAEGADELTHTGDIVGTIRYMAPERFEGRSLPQSDVYGLGLTLYELLTLRPAFADSNKARLIDKALHEPPTPPRKIDAHIPRDLETVVLKCLAKEPAERYASAEALAEDLQRFLADRPIRARRAPWRELAWRWCRRNPAVAGLMAVVAVLLLVIAVGATVSAIRLQGALTESRAHLGRATDAEKDVRETLWGSYLDAAHARRLSLRRGQRFGSLAAIRKALELPLPADRSLAELRNEAASALALPDVEVVREWEGWPLGTVALAFDGALERYARADRQGGVSIRRVADDEEIVRVRIPGLGGDTEQVLSPDFRFAAVYSPATGRLRVWRLTAPDPELVREEPGVHRWSTTFSPDGRDLGYCQDGSVVVLALGDGRLTRWPVKAPDAAGLIFDPTGRQAAFHTWVEGQNVYKVIDVRTGALRAHLPHRSRIGWVAWSPDGRTLATCSDDRRARLWDTATGRTTLVLEGHKAGGVRCLFTPDGERLLSNDWSNLLRVWDVHSGQQVFATPMSYAMFHFGPDGRLPVQEVNKVKLIRVATGRELRTLPRRSAAGRGGYASPFPSGGVALSPQGRLLAATTGEGYCALVGPESGAELAVLTLKTVRSLAFESSGALLTNGEDGLLRWPVALSPATGDCRIGPPQVLFPSPVDCHHGSSLDGRVLAIPDQQRGALVLLRDRPGQPLVLGPQEDVRCCAVSPDGRWVATGTFSNTQGVGAKVWEAASGRLVKDLRMDQGGCYVGFSPDGKWLLTTAGGCRLWAVGTWEEGPVIGKETAFAFSPDGQVLAVGGGLFGGEGEAGVIRLVEPASGKEYVRLDAPEQTRLGPCCFSPDGARLIALGIDSQALHVWDLRRVRAGLRPLGLDWGAPAYAEEDRDQTPDAQRRPLQVQVVGAGPMAEPGKKAAALRLNNEAWRLVTGPLDLRDPNKRALQLVRQALELDPDNPNYLNTLGVVHYRNGQYREAQATLDRSLAAGKGQTAGIDLYFLAMCHARLGDKPKARDCFDRAMKWAEAQKGLPPQLVEELNAFRVEAEEALRDAPPGE